MIPFTIVDKPGCVRTISAAARAASITKKGKARTREQDQQNKIRINQQEGKKKKLTCCS
jgi:hypothetical protein